MLAKFNKFNLANALGFNVIWFLCVLFGNSLLFVVGLMLITHVCLHPQPRFELLFILLIGGIGYLIDCILTFAGIFYFTPTTTLPPAWLLLLWFSFAATARNSLSILPKNIATLVIIGSLVGGTSYYAAYALGAVYYPEGTVFTLYCVAALWSILFPCIMHFSHVYPVLSGSKHTVLPHGHVIKQHMEEDINNAD